MIALYSILYFALKNYSIIYISGIFRITVQPFRLFRGDWFNQRDGANENGSDATIGYICIAMCQTAQGV